MRNKTQAFPVEIIKEENGRGYYVVVPLLPGCFSQGQTIELAKRNIAKAIELHLRELKKIGQIPSALIESYRTTIQVSA